MSHVCPGGGRVRFGFCPNSNSKRGQEIRERGRESEREGEGRAERGEGRERERERADTGGREERVLEREREKRVYRNIGEG
eukprot:1325483-Amorphochlora_amoeboformis.AAC.1